MQQASPPGPVGVRPGEAFRQSYGLVLLNFRTVGRLLLVSMGVAAANCYWIYWLRLDALRGALRAEQADAAGPIWLVPLFIQLLAFAAFAASWHRWILLGPGAVPHGVASFWHRRIGRYVLGSLGLSVLYIVFAVSVLTLFALLAPWSIKTRFVFVVAALVIAVPVIPFCRFCLVLPATAIDSPQVLRTAWDAAAGSTLRMTQAFLYVFVPVLGPGSLICLLLLGAFSSTVRDQDYTAAEAIVVLERVGAIWVVVATLLYGITAALFVALLSVFYRQLNRSGQGGSAPDVD